MQELFDHGRQTAGNPLLQARKKAEEGMEVRIHGVKYLSDGTLVDDEVVVKTSHMTARLEKVQF